MKRREAQSVGEIIAGFMQNEYASGKNLELRACALWKDVVGMGVNRYTTNRWVSDGVLHVTISSASLRNELMMNRSAIMRHLNEMVGDEVIKEIRFH